jgi:hypothetical protein
LSLSLFSSFGGFWYFCPDFFGTKKVQWTGTLVWLLPSTEHSKLIGTSLCPSLTAVEWPIFCETQYDIVSYDADSTPSAIPTLQQRNKTSPVGRGRNVLCNNRYCLSVEVVTFCVTNTVSKIWSMWKQGFIKII